MVYKIFFLFMVLGFICSCNNSRNLAKDNIVNEFGWKAVYKHDKNGDALNGSIDSLINGIRNGYDVRIGWGWEREVADSILRLEHMAEPLFLTIIQEKNVSVVIDAHPLLQSYLDVENQKFGEGGHIWQCVLTTKGTFNAQVHERSTGELIKDWPQRHKMIWFLEYPNTTSRNN